MTTSLDLTRRTRRFARTPKFKTCIALFDALALTEWAERSEWQVHFKWKLNATSEPGYTKRQSASEAAMGSLAVALPSREIALAVWH